MYVKPLTAVEAQALYGPMSTEQLLVECQNRLPGFAIDLHIFAKPMGGVMMTWRYNYAFSPMWRWQCTRPAEVNMGGTHQSVRECLVTVLNRIDRFDTWSYEQDQLQKQNEAAARARRAAAAAPTPKPPEEQDEGDEVVQVEDLPPVTPLPEDAVPVDDKPASTPVS